MDASHDPSEIDPGAPGAPGAPASPGTARAYDAILGGKSNFAADRAIGDGGGRARLSRAALGRAVRMGAAQASEPPGLWLRRQRVAAGLTQEDLAERSGISVRTIADLERGRTHRPYPSSVRALVRALGLPDTAAADLVARYRAAGDAPPTAAAALAAVPRQLPMAVPHFAGRVSELGLLDAMLDDGDGVVISAISGTAGAGKTALALRWAQQVAIRFPDGQLYANLRGFHPADRPADPADVLRRFLGALQVHAEQIPSDVEALAALYRSLLADRRILILLDNAADVAQVRPLLPAAPECLVIVTSRRELSALAACEGAQLLSLDVLTAAEADELLAMRLGEQRVQAEPTAITQLSSLGARLPLALSVIAARATAQPRLPLAALVAELGQSQQRLDALDVDDPAANVRTVFSLSYQHLPDAAARMFRLLGLHPGPDISAPAAASLAGVPLAVARLALRDLARASLIIQNAPGRYSFHDLLRAYAAEQAAAHEDGDGRREALHRILDHYLHTAHRTTQTVYPGHDLIDPGTPGPLAVPEALDAKAAALAWLEAEHQVLLKVIDLAMREGFYDHAWRLPAVLWTFLAVGGHWHDCASAQRTALDAARRQGEQAREACALRWLGTIHVMLGSHAQAHEYLSLARDMFRQLGDKLGLARTDVMMTRSYEYQERHLAALAVTWEALELSEPEADDPKMRLVRAAALNNYTWIKALLGDFGQARAHCLEAIELFRSIDHSMGEASTWDTLGYVEQRQGDHAEAAACFLRAVALQRDSGTRFDLAKSLTHLGETRRSTGDLPAAGQAWAEALAILEDMHHPDAAEVRASLESLGPAAL
jgi:transcriptional regulator with XRE-family HTH domain/tetratricopeptide (TPR) repeat protein